MRKQIVLPLILIYILLSAGCAGEPDTADNDSQITTSNQQDIRENKDDTSLEPTSREEIMPSEIDSTVEHSFLGTVIEETSAYMIVEPDENEEERQLSDRFTVNYPSEHYDYFYGEGRRVVIYYYETPALRSDFEITTDDISTEGFRGFELSVIPAENSEAKKKTMISEGLYYYGISDVIVSVDDQTMSLAEALESGKITLNALLVRANQYVKNGIVEELSYDDGGSALYQYQDYTIIKYHTLDGNRDMYIGSRDMDINVSLQ